MAVCILNVVFALAKGVPQLDGPVTRTGDDLTIVCAEADRQNIGGVANEAAGSQSRVKIPETEGMIPRSRESELAVRRDNDVRHEVVMSMEDSFWVSVRVIIASQLPDNDGLVYLMILEDILGSLQRYVPREAVKIMSGFSDEVAMAVTHPLCPSKDPRKRSDSDMVLSVFWTSTDEEIWALSTSRHVSPP